MAEQKGKASRQRPEQGDQPGSGSAASGGPSTRPASGPAGGDDPERTTAAMEARIAELEADLAAAKTTIKALLDKVERGAGRPAKSRAGALSGDTDVNVLVRNLDRLIRQRTRALAESEKQLRHKSNELERITEMKAEFISVAAHELRTPLTSIVGYLDLMAEGSFGDLPRPMERPMASLRRNAYRLKRVVDEMLDVSRIDSGRVTLLRRPCDIGKIVREVVTEMADDAQPKNLKLSASIDEPPEIYADIKKIRQMVAKLIANAIRHTPENGAITVTVDTAPQEQAAGVWARIRVKCTGIDIPDHLRSRLFEPFTAVSKARHHTSAGPDSAGLGLYIARGLSDLHGGLISVDSAEGAHTEFTVLLPMSEPTEPVIVPPVNPG